MTTVATPEPLTFEDGYTRLKAIRDRLGEDDATLDERCNLYAEGKSLEVALLEYLQTKEGELAEIEAGTDTSRFQIVAAATPATVPAQPITLTPAHQ